MSSGRERRTRHEVHGLFQDERLVLGGERLVDLPHGPRILTHGQGQGGRDRGYGTGKKGQDRDKRQATRGKGTGSGRGVERVVVGDRAGRDRRVEADSLEIVRRYVEVEEFGMSGESKAPVESRVADYDAA